MFDLQDKIALVTGASGGIGAEIAKALHARGATVVLHGTRAEKLESLKAELGERAFVVTANLADRDAVAGLIDAASTAAGGPIVILVNNAGITRDGLLMRMKDEDWDDVLEVNLTASMILCRAAMRGYDEGALRPDYLDFIGCWSDWQSGTGKLCSVKGWHDWL